MCDVFKKKRRRNQASGSSQKSIATWQSQQKAKVSPQWSQLSVNRLAPRSHPTSSSTRADTTLDSPSVSAPVRRSQSAERARSWRRSSASCWGKRGARRANEAAWTKQREVRWEVRARRCANMGFSPNGSGKGEMHLLVRAIHERLLA